MKFRLISRQGVDEGTGEIPDSFAGEPTVLVWNGRTFLAEDVDIGDQPPWTFREVLGQALDHHQVMPPPKVAERWTSPTAIGRMAEKAPDVVDSVAPGYVAAPGVPVAEVPCPPELWDALPLPEPRRRRGEPS